jgi:hypothetical protein
MRAINHLDEKRSTPLVVASAFLLAVVSTGAAAQDGRAVRESGSSSRIDDRREMPAHREEDRGVVPNYGWHYEWDPERREWTRTYGWFEEFYEDRSGTRSGRDSRSTRDASGTASRDGIEWSNDGWDAEPAERLTAMAEQQTLSGRIESFGRLRERDGTHYLLRVQDENGRTRIIDLGTRVRPGELAFQRGDTVRFRGSPATSTSMGMEVFRAVAFTDRADDIRTSGARARSDGSSRSSGQSGTGRVTFTGTLEGLRETQQPGTRERSLVVLLERPDGTARVVDLGPSARLRSLGLRRGDELTVVGEQRDSSGRPLLYAHQLRVGDSTMGLRSTQDVMREGVRDPGRQLRSFRGELLQAARTRLSGLPETQLLMRLQLRDGSAQIVDFGSEAERTDLSLDPGDLVHVRGQYEVRAGVELLRAQELSVNGEPVDFSASERGAAREASAGREKERPGGGGREVELSGTLETFEQTRLAGTPAGNLIVRVMLQDGTTRIVDFGSAHTLDELGLERGETVSIDGKEKTVSGETYVRAERLEVGDRTMRIEEQREDERSEP